MITYPKMQTLFKRDMKTHKIQPGIFSKPEFENIREWEFTEKIDGMNIRVEYSNSDLCYGSSLGIRFTGRTGKSILSEKMDLYLEEKFNHVHLDMVFEEAKDVVLFGEGYGGGIQQGGGKYREDNGFILFDVWTDGWWLTRESVEQVAHDIGCKCVPIVPGTTFEDAIAYVLSKPQSLITENEKMAEGIVATCNPLMLFRNGHPMKWKLKVQDYIDLGMIE
jgi:hypothetical protein